jgi:diketogulonate reductase-like aldo/keto reductase
MTRRELARERPVTTPFVEANGARIPAIGLGTWDLRERTCVRMVEHALRLGYRHIDTAEMYGNEREVGEGLRASGVPRAHVFVTTKVWPDHLAPRELERATKESLAKLRLSEVDLLLIHWPNPRVPLADTIGALCRMKREGFTRHIGVSNFTVDLLAEVVKLATEPLVTDQIEWHPFIDQAKVVEACRGYGLAVTAYSPLARAGCSPTKPCAGSVSGMARPPGRWGCAISSSAAPSSFPAARGRRALRQILRFSTSSSPRPRWRRSRGSPTRAGGLSTGRVRPTGIEAPTRAGLTTCAKCYVVSCCCIRV